MSGQDDRNGAKSDSTELMSVTGGNSLNPNVRANISLEVKICETCGQAHYKLFLVTLEQYYNIREAQEAFKLSVDTLTNVGYHLTPDASFL